MIVLQLIHAFLFPCQGSEGDRDLVDLGALDPEDHAGAVSGAVDQAQWVMAARRAATSEVHLPSVAVAAAVVAALPLEDPLH